MVVVTALSVRTLQEFEEVMGGSCADVFDFDFIRHRSEPFSAVEVMDGGFYGAKQTPCVHFTLPASTLVSKLRSKLRRKLIGDDASSESSSDDEDELDGDDGTRRKEGEEAAPGRSPVDTSPRKPPTKKKGGCTPCHLLLFTRRKNGTLRPTYPIYDLKTSKVAPDRSPPEGGAPVTDTFSTPPRPSDLHNGELSTQSSHIRRVDRERRELRKDSLPAEPTEPRRLSDLQTILPEQSRHLLRLLVVEEPYHLSSDGNAHHSATVSEIDAVSAVSPSGVGIAMYSSPSTPTQSQSHLTRRHSNVSGVSHGGSGDRLDDSVSLSPMTQSLASMPPASPNQSLGGLTPSTSNVAPSVLLPTARGALVTDSLAIESADQSMSATNRSMQQVDRRPNEGLNSLNLRVLDYSVGAFVVIRLFTGQSMMTSGAVFMPHTMHLETLLTQLLSFSKSGSGLLRQQILELFDIPSSALASILDHHSPVYELVRPERLDWLDIEQTCAELELHHGDVLVFDFSEFLRPWIGDLDAEEITDEALQVSETLRPPRPGISPRKESIPLSPSTYVFYTAANVCIKFNLLAPLPRMFRTIDGRSPMGAGFTFSILCNLIADDFSDLETKLKQRLIKHARKWYESRDLRLPDLVADGEFDLRLWASKEIKTPLRFVGTAVGAEAQKLTSPSSASSPGSYTANTAINVAGSTLESSRVKRKVKALSHRVAGSQMKSAGVSLFSYLYPTCLACMLQWHNHTLKTEFQVTMAPAKDESDRESETGSESTNPPQPGTPTAVASRLYPRRSSRDSTPSPGPQVPANANLGVLQVRKLIYFGVIPRTPETVPQSLNSSATEISKGATSPTSLLAPPTDARQLLMHWMGDARNQLLQKLQVESVPHEAQSSLLLAIGAQRLGFCDGRRYWEHAMSLARGEKLPSTVPAPELLMSTLLLSVERSSSIEAVSTVFGPIVAAGSYPLPNLSTVGQLLESNRLEGALRLRLEVSPVLLYILLLNDEKERREILAEHQRMRNASLMGQSIALKPPLTAAFLLARHALFIVAHVNIHDGVYFGTPSIIPQQPTLARLRDEMKRTFGARCEEEGWRYAMTAQPVVLKPDDPTGHSAMPQTVELKDETKYRQLLAVHHAAASERMYMDLKSPQAALASTPRREGEERGSEHSQDSDTFHSHNSSPKVPESTVIRSGELLLGVGHAVLHDDLGVS